MAEANVYKAQSISIVTLGVESVERSVAFYEALGWECSPDSDPKMCTFMPVSYTHLTLTTNREVEI